MIFDHETTPAIRSKSTGRLYASVADLVAAEGKKLLGAIVQAAGIEATEEEIALLWGDRAKLLALVLAAQRAMEGSAAEGTQARPAGAQTFICSRCGDEFLLPGLRILGAYVCHNCLKPGEL